MFKKNGVLILKDSTPVARGGNRHVFFHPENKDLLIKVNSPVAHKRFTRKRWLGKFFQRRYLCYRYRFVMRETWEYIASYAFEDKRPAFIQQVVGFVDTDFGLGYVTKAERDGDGNLAPTLKRLAEEGRFDETVKKDLKTFLTWYLNHPVICGDFCEGNIVHAWDEQIGSYFVLIDGLGEKNVIPFNTLSKRFNRMTKLRKIRQMLNRLKCSIDFKK